MNYSKADYAAALLRSALGLMFVAHGLLKVLVFTLPGTAAFFVSVGLPGLLAYPVAAAEIAGGAALLLGIFVRPVSIALIPVLAGATWVHIGNGWLFTAANGGWEYPALLTLVALAVALLGEGAFTVRRRESKFTPAGV